MKKARTDSLEYIAKKPKQEQNEYLKTGIVKRVALYARQSVDKKTVSASKPNWMPADDY